MDNTGGDIYTVPQLSFSREAKLFGVSFDPTKTNQTCFAATAFVNANLPINYYRIADMNGLSDYGASTGVFPGSSALAIDTKMDDSLPNVGNVVIYDWNMSLGDPNSVYDMAYGEELVYELEIKMFIPTGQDE